VDVSLVCTGLPLDRYARPVGDPCGATWTGATLDHAAVIGWRLGPPTGAGPRPALCPRCVRGDQGDPPPSPLGDVLADQLSLFPTT
jgi:hypothetical protein